MVQLSDIVRLPIQAHMSRQAKRLRSQAPKYLRSVIEDTQAVTRIDSIKELDRRQFEAKPILGGMLSACYLVQHQGQEPVVIKLRYDGIKAEAEALRFWREQGVRTVKVLSHGVVPATRRRLNRVHYLMLEAVLDNDGQPAMTADEYVNKFPRSAKRIGRMMGQELARMHRKKVGRTFGEYADLPGADSQYRSWNKYLQGYIDVHHLYLRSLGIARADLNKLHRIIDRIKFNDRGGYAHGDFSMRNTLIANLKPLKIMVFDPNPVIGDPTWDMAVLRNNYHFQKRKVELAPRRRTYQRQFQIHRDCWRGFVQGYEETSKEPIDFYKILFSQLVQTFFLTRIEERKLKVGNRRTSRSSQLIEFQARKDNLLAKMYLLTHLSGDEAVRYG